MNPGPSETFIQEKSIEKYLQIKELPTWETYRALSGEQQLKNDYGLGFGDEFPAPAGMSL